MGDFIAILTVFSLVHRLAFADPQSSAPLRRRRLLVSAAFLSCLSVFLLEGLLTGAQGHQSGPVFHLLLMALLGVVALLVIPLSDRTSAESRSLGVSDLHGEAPTIQDLELTLRERAKELDRTKEVLRDRSETLDRFHRVTQNRELEMVKLKKEVDALLDELSRPRKYAPPVSAPRSAAQ